MRRTSMRASARDGGRDGHSGRILAAVSAGEGNKVIF